MTASHEERHVEQMAQVLNRHREELLEDQECTGVAISRKEVGGKRTEMLSITVYVHHKGAGMSVPAELDGFPTDVVEQKELRAELTGTDPFARYDPIFGGITIAPLACPSDYGSMGCFIRTPGKPENKEKDCVGIEPGVYLMTCEHVLEKVEPGKHGVIQPAHPGWNVPDDDIFGNYVAGYESETEGYDCAICTVDERQLENSVPNYPWYPGLRLMQGVGVAVPDDKVYKYGAATKFTKGVVDRVHYTQKRSPTDREYRDTIVVRAEGGTNDLWVATGDSGSVTIRQRDDCVLALNFAGNIDHLVSVPWLPWYGPDPHGYSYGFGYDIQSQMDFFAAAEQHATLV